MPRCRRRGGRTHSPPEPAACAPVQMDEDVKRVVALLVRCAFGRPADAGAPIPRRGGCVEVAVREGAFNPLTPPSAAAPRDETIYVAFQQHIRFQARAPRPRCGLPIVLPPAGWPPGACAPSQSSVRHTWGPEGATSDGQDHHTSGN